MASRTRGRGHARTIGALRRYETSIDRVGLAIGAGGLMGGAIGVLLMVFAGTHDVGALRGRVADRIADDRAVDHRAGSDPLGAAPRRGTARADRRRDRSAR